MSNMELSFSTIENNLEDMIKIVDELKKEIQNYENKIANLSEEYWRLKVCKFIGEDTNELYDDTWEEYYKFLNSADLNKVLYRDLPLKICVKYITDKNVNVICYHDRVDLLEWLKNKNMPLPDMFGVISAVMYGQVNILKWAKSNNLPLPNRKQANIPVEYGHINVLEWMKSINIFPDENGANKAAQYGRINVLEWMKSNSLPLPTINGAIWAKEMGHVHVLEWLKNNNLHLPRLSAKEVKTYNWMIENGLFEKEDKN